MDAKVNDGAGKFGCSGLGRGEGEARRAAIVDALKAAEGPLSGTALAERFGVSRQVVVQDVALLRSAGCAVTSTNRGYVLAPVAGDGCGGIDGAGSNGGGRGGNGGDRCGCGGSAADRGMPTRLIKVRHTPEQTGTELNAIVDLGGYVENVMVNHRVYGRVEVPLRIRSRRDVRLFLDDLASGVSSPLMTVTDGYHFHLVAAPSAEVLDEIEAALDGLGMLAQLTDYERETF